YSDLDANGGDTAWIVQGTAITKTWTTSDDDLAIAVASTIRAMNWTNSTNGNEYDLNGNIINANAYAPIVGFQGQLLDGTTDGSAHNYVGEWAGIGNIWQTDRNWANGTVLFDSEKEVIGITYDPTNSSLWISADFGLIYNYDLSGNLLSSFDPG